MTESERESRYLSLSLSTRMTESERESGKKMMTMITKKKKIQERNPRASTSSGPPDRISELPVEILHHILGFLEMDEFLIRTSLVSTKWRNLWKSVSNLKFPTCTDDDDSVVVDNGGDGGNRGIRSNVEKYQNFVDHVLRLRDSEASKIEIFRYYWHDDSITTRVGYDLLERLIHNFIASAAINQGAQEIIIDGACFSIQSGNNNNMIIHLNPSIFNSGGLLLRKFTFNIYTTDFIIQFPRSMCCATQLTHLSLSRIRLPEGDESNAQLHLVCPVLERFDMNSCYSEHLKVLDISAPRLYTLSIRNSCMRHGHFDGLGGCRIEIRTPNLISLDFCGDAYVDCFMESLPRVASACLTFWEETGMVEEITSFATKLLKGLTSAQSLTLEGFEVFSQDTLKCLLTPFTSLTTLELISSCKISSIHGAVHLLSSCNNSIKEFVWVVDQFVGEVEGDEHLMLPQCKLSYLKHVSIECLRGHENEIEFVKFLLKSSVVLEDLIIITTVRDSLKQTIEENLKQFIEEELSFRSIKLEIL